MDDFKVLERFINFTSMRHGIITSNIANADTPEYKAKDVSFQKNLDAEMELRTTDPKHITVSENSLQREKETGTSNPWADGNTVELDMEVAKMTENAMLFQAGISMLTTKIRMFKNAIRR